MQLILALCQLSTGQYHSCEWKTISLIFVFSLDIQYFAKRRPLDAYKKLVGGRKPRGTKDILSTFSFVLHPFGGAFHQNMGLGCRKELGAFTEAGVFCQQNMVCTSQFCII